MARRAKPHDEELPFVALRDTMTNVVGVLIIVLVMIGIGLAKSVQKVLSELPMVSVEEHDKLKAAMAEFDVKRDPAEVAAEIAKRQAELDKIAEALKKLEAEKAASPVVMVDLEKLVQELDKLRKERDQRKTAAEAVLAEIDRLKKKLDTTPRYEPPPGVIVRLPAPRPMPEKAELQRIFVSAGKVSFARNEELSDIVEEQLRKEDPAFFLKKEVLKGPDGKPLTKKGPTGQNIVQRKIYVNGNKMTDFFNTAFNQRKAGPHRGRVGADRLGGVALADHGDVEIVESLRLGFRARQLGHVRWQPERSADFAGGIVVPRHEDHRNAYRLESR
jgi:hypothetical protein